MLCGITAAPQASQLPHRHHAPTGIMLLMSLSDITRLVSLRGTLVSHRGILVSHRGIILSFTGILVSYRHS